MNAAEDLESVVSSTHRAGTSLGHVLHGLGDDGLLGDGVLEHLLGNIVASFGQRDEIRLHPAGGDLEDVDALVLQFLTETVAVEADERFARGVYIQLLQWQISGCGAHLDDVGSGRHARYAEVRYLDESGKVESDHGPGIGNRDLPGVPEPAHAGAVDQEADLGILLFQNGCQTVYALGIGKIDGEGFTRCFQLGSELPEPVVPASDDPDGIQPVAV